MLAAAIVPVTPFQQNCTLIWNEETKRGAVVDPGGDVPRLRKAITELGLTIETILLTHGHIDHAGGAKELKEALGVEIVGPHESDRMLLESIETQGRIYGIGGVRNVLPDRWLADGDAVTVGGATLEVLHCPGHSPGSVVFLSREQSFALVGDVIFAGSIGRTDLPGGDHAQLLRSIRDKLLPLPDEIQFICGHGPSSTIGEERRTNPFLVG